MSKRSVPDMRRVLYGARGDAEEPTRPTAAELTSAGTQAPMGAGAQEHGSEAVQVPTSTVAAAPNNAGAAEPAAPGAHARRPKSGSLTRPYARKDGRQIVNVTFSLPVDLARKIRVHVAGMDPGTRGEWAAKWLRRGMDEG